MQEQKVKTKKLKDSTMSEIISKIQDSENILIALSKDPTADELAAAIGLSLYLDKAGKHATAIYSGEAPNVLDFLGPDQRLESNTDSLQDFIIAINKDKADHLRYKVEGDYVRVYITPYKTKISAEDLEFSHGDFNIGLVVALNVHSEESLDAALTNHGRILHDAEIINIGATASGDFGQTQWLDPSFSSVSEMVANLVFSMEDELGNDLDDEIATALLTGIFIATDRFSNGRTKPETMNMAARLMSAGANQQQISAHLALEDGGVQNIASPAIEKNLPEPKGNDSDIVGNNSGETLDLRIHREEQQDDSDNIPDEQIVEQEIEPVVNELKIAQNPGFKEESVGDNHIESSEELVPSNNESNDMIPETSISTPQDISMNSFELPTVPTNNIVEPDIKPSLDQVATPFEETPVPDFANSADGLITEQNQISNSQFLQDISQPILTVQPPVNNAMPVENNGAVNPINAFTVTNTLPVNSQVSPTPSPIAQSENAILGKDYGALMDEAIKADDALQNQQNQQPQHLEHGFIGGNPALMAAPGVSDAPEANSIPGIDYSGLADATEDEKPAGVAQDNIGVLGRDYPTEAASIPPSQVASNAPHLAPLPHSDSVSFLNTNESVQTNALSSNQDMTLEPKPMGMPLPGEEILPPPPTPPIDFGSVPAAQSTGEPVLPPVDDNLMKSSVVVQPDAPAPQIQPAQFAQPVVNNDPGAFHIPGM